MEARASRQPACTRGAGWRRMSRTSRFIIQTSSFSPSSASAKQTIRSNLIWPDLLRVFSSASVTSSAAGRALHSVRATQGRALHSFRATRGGYHLLAFATFAPALSMVEASGVEGTLREKSFPALDLRAYPKTHWAMTWRVPSCSQGARRSLSRSSIQNFADLTLKADSGHKAINIKIGARVCVRKWGAEWNCVGVK